MKDLDRLKRARRDNQMYVTPHAFEALWLRGDHRRVTEEQVFDQIVNGGFQVGPSYEDQVKYQARDWPVVFVIRKELDGTIVVVTALSLGQERSGNERMSGSREYRRGVQKIRERQR